MGITRTIFHVDMDAFYASVEQRDHPAYRGKPVIVGADPKEGRGRGVVAACSYEARRFGIHSALPISQAYRLCPQGIFVRPDFPRYLSVSRQIRELFLALTPLVEPVSIDEAFLDVSQRVSDPVSALQLARTLQREIYRRQRLTASIGIGPNKLVAKIASDLRKPRGLLLIRPEEVRKFLDPLPISRLWGVGPRTEERLGRLGIRSIRDLRLADRRELGRVFGKLGEGLWCLANGLDERPVVPRRETKSLSREHTFGSDVLEMIRLEEALQLLAEQVASRLSRQGLKGRTVTLKLRYADFTTITRQTTLNHPPEGAEELGRIALELLRRHRDLNQRVRLIGLAVSSFEKRPSEGQLRLF